MNKKQIMRPKRIYVNSKTLQKVTAENHAGHTMRVKAFASKQDVEYTDLSQVWHDGSEVPLVDRRIIYESYQKQGCFYSAKYIGNPLQFINDVKRGAYAKDLFPHKTTTL